ncbi:MULTISPECIES: L,D-transpeptidase [Bacteria]|uniref:L,D-transpeptidase n=1 Tax=Bacteria TaxID=2 RepID=UPI003C7DB438
MKRLSKRVALVLGAGVIAAGTLATVLIVGMTSRPDEVQRDSLAAATPDSSAPEPSADAGRLASAELAEARYDAAIPALPAAPADIDPMAALIGTLSVDAVVSAEPGGVPVAFLAAKNFLDEPTTVLVVAHRDDGWSQVLTPARSSRPSEDPAAPAQTAGWIRTDTLGTTAPVSERIVIAVGSQTLSIVGRDGTTRTYPVGVGAEDTPTPVGVTGYLQARYLDPAQGQTEHRIQLASLHSTASDEPFGGTDGGLIGIHYNTTNTGAVSHGCLRLDAEGISAVDALPLGTPVTIIE